MRTDRRFSELFSRVVGAFCVRRDEHSALSGFDAFDGSDAVDRLVERRDSPDAGALGTRNEIRLGEVEAIDLVDLDRS